MSQLADFVRARKLFAYGELTEERDYFDHPNCVGWVRTGDREKGRDGCAVLMCNGDEGHKWMDVGKEHAGEKWTDVLRWHHGEVVIDDNGWGMFRCPARSVSIWVKNNARGREEFRGNLEERHCRCSDVEV
jgi:alpha-amylase